MSSAPQKLVVIPQTTKVLACGNCGRNLIVTIRTVMAFCQTCSAGMGIKR